MVNYFPMVVNYAGRKNCKLVSQEMTAPATNTNTNTRDTNTNTEKKNLGLVCKSKHGNDKSIMANYFPMVVNYIGRKNCKLVSQEMTAPATRKVDKKVEAPSLIVFRR